MSKVKQLVLYHTTNKLYSTEKVIIMFSLCFIRSYMKKDFYQIFHHNKRTDVETWTKSKSCSPLPKSKFGMVHLKTVKNDEKCFLFHFKFLSNKHMMQEVLVFSSLFIILFTIKIRN